MGVLIVIRHGFSESNKKGYLTHDVEGYPLTEEGKKYIIKASKEIKKIKNIKEIVSSPILRARETAEIISQNTGLKIRIDERLSERFMGGYNNQKIPESKPDQIDHNWHTKEILNNYPNGLEKWENLISRTKEVLNSLPSNQNFIIITHGDVIKAIVAIFLNLDEFEVWGIRANHGHFTVIDTKNGRILAIGSPILSERLINKIKETENG